MKTTLTKNLLLLFVVTVFLSACKDDPEPSGGTTTEKYFAGENGSSWVYSNQSISSSGEATTLTANDTLTFSKDTALIEKNAKWVTHNFLYPFGSGISNTANYGLAQEGSQVSVSSDFMKLLIPQIVADFIPIEDNRWMLLANGNVAAGSSWNIYSKDFNNVTIEDFPIPLTLAAGTTKMDVIRQADTTFNGEASHYYKMRIYYQGTATSSQYPQIAVFGEVRITFAEVNFFLASGKGLLGINAVPHGIVVQSVEVPAMSLDLSTLFPQLTMPGFAKTLISSGIK